MNGFLDPLETIRTQPTAPEAVTHLKVYVRNAIVRPNMDVINVTKAVFLEKVGNVPGALSFLKDSVGFEEGGGVGCIYLPRLDPAGTKERLARLIQCYVRLEMVWREIGTAVVAITVHSVKIEKVPAPNPWCLMIGGHCVWSNAALPSWSEAVQRETTGGVTAAITSTGTTHGVCAPVSLLGSFPRKMVLEFRHPKTAEVFAFVTVSIECRLDGQPLEEEEADSVRRTVFAEYSAAMKEDKS